MTKMTQLEHIDCLANMIEGRAGELLDLVTENRDWKFARREISAMQEELGELLEKIDREFPEKGTTND